MAGTGRIYRRGHHYYIAYRWDGREYRESARSSDRTVAERLLAQRLRERAGHEPTGDVTFDTLADGYLDDYVVRGLRTLDTARGRVANLRSVFGGWAAVAITAGAIREYQRQRRTAGAAAATVNRETSALSRMFHLAVRLRRVSQRPAFPERLEENGPRQGFFEHQEYEAVRRHLPLPYQDVLDFAYYSGWRKREILELRWSEVDARGGVVRLSPERSKTRVGRVLPISAPIAAVLARRLAQRQGDDRLVFGRDAVTVRAWRTAWPEACRRAGVPGRLLHDCRRTAARNLVRAGVNERVAMQLTGHRSRAIFDRYNIVREDELHQAGAQLVAYVNAQVNPSPSARLLGVLVGPDVVREGEAHAVSAGGCMPPTRSLAETVGLRLSSGSDIV